MKCPKCGKKIYGNFCSNCGKDVRPPQSESWAKRHPVKLYLLLFIVSFFIFEFTLSENASETASLPAVVMLLPFVLPGILTYLILRPRKAADQKKPFFRSFIQSLKTNAVSAAEPAQAETSFLPKRLTSVLSIAVQAIGLYFLFFFLVYLAMILIFPAKDGVLQIPPFGIILLVFLPGILSALMLYLGRKQRVLQKDFTPEDLQPEPQDFLDPQIQEPEPFPISAPDPLELIREMERDFRDGYQWAFSHMLNESDCKKMYHLICKKYQEQELPLPVEIRFEQLKEEYLPKFEYPNPMVVVDGMNGADFESFCADLLRANGFRDVSVTAKSGDQGVDIIAQKEDIRYAVQCKCYSSNLGNTPIQEVHAGKSIYSCQIGVVMTNRYFTSGAKALAASTGVLLWDRDKLMSLIPNMNTHETLLIGEE